MIFSKGNPLNTRKELVAWIESLSPQNSNYLEQTGGSYPKEIRYLESLLRPLWGLIPAHSQDFSGLLEEYQFKELLRLIKERRLPEISTENRQIAVELGVIGYAIGSFGTGFLDLIREDDTTYFVKWLNQVNTIEFPAGNWYFFLVLVNAGLKNAGLPYSEERLTFVLEGIEGFYLGDGWYSDGANQQRDYYVSFAFHYYGLLYSRFGEEKIGQKFRSRAVDFSREFLYWFDDFGRSLPFGRSLTYRFAHTSFWSALVISGAWQETDLSLGEIKGLILRNLRFWHSQPITQSGEGTLSIGYGYSNLIMSEDYNALGSPMWAFKTFTILELVASDAFWESTEELLPQKQNLSVQNYAGFHIQSMGREIVALSSRQFVVNDMLYHNREKYSKFAYSSAFGFNLTRDNQGLDRFAVDSTLAFSIPDTDQWQTRGIIDKSWVYPSHGVSFWTVWGRVQVTTYLIPVEGDGHIRIHHIDNDIPVEAVEGGFPLSDWNRKYQTPQLTKSSALLINQLGYSKIQDLLKNRRSDVVTQGPNTNIYSCEKNAIPVLKSKLLPGNHTFAAYVSGSYQRPETEISYEINETFNFYELRQIDDKELLRIEKERF